MPRPSESCLTPASYTTRLNHFYARDESRRTISNAAGDIDSFVFAPHNLMAMAIESGVVVRDEIFDEAEKFVRRQGGQGLAPLSFSDPTYWDPIDKSLNAASVLNGAEYILYFDPYQGGGFVRFDNTSPIYLFVQRWARGYYPQLLEEPLESRSLL